MQSKFVVPSSANGFSLQTVSDRCTELLSVIFKHRWKNRCSERPADLSKVTQRGSEGARLWTQKLDPSPELFPGPGSGPSGEKPGWYPAPMAPGPLHTPPRAKCPQGNESPRNSVWINYKTNLHNWHIRKVNHNHVSHFLRISVSARHSVKPFSHMRSFNHHSNTERWGLILFPSLRQRI